MLTAHALNILDAESNETDDTIPATVEAFSDCIKIVIGEGDREVSIYVEQKQGKTGICIVANGGLNEGWVHVDPTADRDDVITHD